MTVNLASFDEIRFEDRAHAESRLTTLLEGSDGLLAQEDSVTRRHAVLRNIQRREILRIGTRDVHCYALLPSVPEDPSNLADVMAEAA